MAAPSRQLIGLSQAFAAPSGCPEQSLTVLQAGVSVGATAWLGARAEPLVSLSDAARSGAVLQWRPVEGCTDLLPPSRAEPHALQGAHPLLRSLVKGALPGIFTTLALMPVHVG